MKIDSAICAQIEIIGMGIVPPEVREYKSFSGVYAHTLSYSRVDVSKALSVLNDSDAVTAKRKFRKLFRKACEWRLQQITLFDALRHSRDLSESTNRKKRYRLTK
jgi:hypothetical protein